MEKGIRKAGSILHTVSMVMLAGLLFLGTGDVIGRYFLNMPIKGAHEAGEIMLAAVVIFSWAYTLSVKGHVRMELLFSRLPPRIQGAIDFFTSFVLLILFSLIMWQGIELARFSMKMGRLVDVLYIPVFPFHLFISVGAFFIALELIVQLFYSFAQIKKRT